VVAFSGCHREALKNPRPEGGPDEAAPPGPGVLATGQKVPRALSVDRSNVYWFNLGTNMSRGKLLRGWSGGQVMRCAIGGCEDAPTALVSGRRQYSFATPLAFATDGFDVYWSDSGTEEPSDAEGSSGGVLKCATTGCGDSPSLLTDSFAWDIALSKGMVYWTDFGAGEVFACPLIGCEAGPESLWPAGDNPPLTLGIAVDETDVYWSTAAKDTIMKCALAGCGGTPTAIMSDAPVTAIRQIALDASNVYFVDSNPGGGVFACAKSGCGDHPTVLAFGLNIATAIATDGVNVYWTEVGSPNAALAEVPGAGVVRKCSVSGCANTPTTIASGLNVPVAIAVDASNVYWAEAGAGTDDGRIQRAPK